uniref:Zn(2)-C6 fungal-type domain-containing protein n=1 Tax=Bionectria ochroleuca TaxID=29856 RepID=A0A8H7K6A7_BIOOC
MNPDPSPQRLVGRERRQGMRKGRQACDSCRAGKRKCDGARPVCGTCNRRGPRGSCEYGKSGGRTSRTSKQIELLEQRIAELEGDRFRTPGAESNGDPPPHTQPCVSSQRAAEPPALEHTSAGDFSYGRPTTDAPLPASLSPQPSDMGLPGDLPFVQDPPGAGRHQRVMKSSITNGRGLLHVSKRNRYS